MPLARHPRAYRLWRALRLSRGGRALAAAWRGRATAGRLARHDAAVLAPDPSHAGEWPHLRDLLGRLGLLGQGFVVDLAAGDGVAGSCTLPLFRDHGWGGLAVECDPSRFALLARAYRRFPAARCVRARVRPEDAAALLRAHGAPREFTVLNLDIDSYDLPLASALLREFRPLVVDMEVNEKVPPPVRFALRYAPGFRWDEGHCYGCSLSAACDALGAAGYRLQGLRYNNAFFVRADVAERGGIEAPAPEAAYREGYLERADRHRLFPWNADMEDLPGLEPPEAVRRLERRFRGAGAPFVLQLEPLLPGWEEADA